MTVSGGSFLCNIKQIIPGLLPVSFYVLQPKCLFRQLNRFILTDHLTFIITYTDFHYSNNSMNSLADVWVRSGKESKYLYPGSKKEVITELKSWLKRRETLNNILAECCDVFPIVGSQLQIRALLESHHQSQNQEDLDQIASLKAMQMRSRIPIRVSHCTDHSESLTAK